MGKVHFEGIVERHVLYIDHEYQAMQKSAAKRQKQWDSAPENTDNNGLDIC